MARYALACAALVLLALVVAGAPSRAHGPLTPLTAWEYRWLPDGAWTPIALPAHPPSAPAALLEMRTALPAHTPRDAVVAIDAVVAPFEARIDDAPAHHAHPVGEGLAARWPPGLPWQLIAVPEGQGARTLTLRIRAAGQGKVVRGTPFLAARADALAWTLDRDLGRLGAGVAALLLGLFGLVAFASRGDRRVALGYALATTCLGLYVLVYTHAKDLVVDAPRAWFVVWLVAVPCQPIGATLYVDALFGSGPRGVLRRLFHAFVIAALALAACHAISLALYVSGDAGAERAALGLFTWATNAHRLLLVAGSALVVAVVARRALRAGDEAAVDARIFLAGFSFMFVVVVRDVVAALGYAPLSWRSQMHLGVLVLTGTLAVLLARRHARVSERAAALAQQTVLQAREKERLLRDLHDGVGSLTSNVRLLAELELRRRGAGARTDAHTDGDAARTLATIAELSATALAELRSFVQALDDASMTYDALFADLRRFGASVADGAGVAFRMSYRAAAPAGAAAPPGLLAINVVRLFREAVTNALKQEGVTEIAVDVALAADALELTVVNDGGADGRRAGGIDAGRGLANLRVRAQELGGALELELGARTRLSLRVPLPLRTPSAPEAPPNTPDPRGDAGGYARGR